MQVDGEIIKISGNSTIHFKTDTGRIPVKGRIRQFKSDYQ